ncbi:MAG TPA: OmpA family protein [Terriglobales bacterium]|jgi:outer membrane protein OmpA-like peptidoglycan-associated protein|nr:OmpA family protein [Terriglobales bacterium]
MKQFTLSLFLSLTVLASLSAMAQQLPQVPNPGLGNNPARRQAYRPEYFQAEKSAPVIQINVSRNIQTVNYWARGSTKVNFIGTALLPRAEGRATVQSTGGALAIEAEFNGLAPVATFGPEYLTYVLWAITPEGLANNLGEVQVRDGKSNVKASTKLQTFGMIVTAEPYFAVTFPSDEVVMENSARSDTKGAVDSVNAKFELLQRGRYSDAHLEAFPFDPKVPLDLYEARNALRIAKWQKADQYAAESFGKAQDALNRAEDYQKRKQKQAVATTAREAVQMAEDARAISVKRQEDERIANEQRDAQQREAAAKAAQEAEALRRTQAEAAAAKDAQARALAEAAAARDAQARAEAEAAAAKDAQARAQAEQEQKAAQAREQQAQQAAAQAEREKQELRAKLLEQFNRVLPTRDSQRGLVVNLGDVLFDIGKANLRPAAREALAKLSGIVLNYPQLKLTVEGHTDNTGSDEFNQTLSEKRASSVRDYLVVQGLTADSISATGLGKTDPIADNTTAAGRQKNRRVEIIVSGEVIGTQIGGTQ